jgi:hypothetical protein
MDIDDVDALGENEAAALFATGSRRDRSGWCVDDRGRARSQPARRLRGKMSRRAMSSRTDAAFEAWVDRARLLPIEAGLLDRPLALKRIGRELVGPCPACGGRDRFAINPSKGLWCCRHCNRGGNDAISLAMHVAGVSFVEAIELLVGERKPTASPNRTSTPSKAKSSRVDANRDLAAAARIVAGMRPILGTPCERYLAQDRGIDTSPIRDVLNRTDAIGWNPSVYLNEPGHNLHGQRLGCIVGIMTDPVTTQPTGAISRTYINSDLRKIGKAKTLGRPKGIVRLSRDEDVQEGLHLAEGIETALTAMAKGKRPTWAVGDANMMAKFPVLGGIGCITFFADHDRNRKGEIAAHGAAKRWRDAGRETHILRRSVLGDLNDAIRAKAAP